MNTLKKIGKALAFRAIASGVRLPQPKMLDDFRQWSHLADLVRRLDINVFLDVGANRGIFSKQLRACGYSGHIFSFEPIPEDCDCIRKLASNDVRWTVCNYALGATDSTECFHINQSGGKTVLSSFLSIDPTALTSFEQLQNQQTIQVSVKRLDEILPPLIAAVQSPRIFLKMDTQGFDSNVFDGAERLLDKIIGLQSEISVIPLYAEMLHYTESLAHYERFGFALVDLFPVHRMVDDRILEYDCVMVKTGDKKLP